MRLMPGLRKFRFAQFVLAAGLCLEGPSWCHSQLPQLSPALSRGVPIPQHGPALEDDPSEVIVAGGLTAAEGEPGQPPRGPILLTQAGEAPPVEAPPVQPPPVQPPPVQPPPAQGAGGSPLGGVGAPSAEARAAVQASSGTALPSGSDIVGGNSALALGATDAGSLLAKSTSALGVENQYRSPIANETRVRGEHLGQIQTFSDGQYWFPARQDLDTFLSKVDSGIIRDMIITKGPYTALLGPGFSFIDIQTFAPPRYKDGFEWHGRTVSEYNSNGDQFYARQVLEMGSDNWGARISYGQRTGNDYGPGSSGPSFAIEASYNSRDVNFDYGMDLSKDSHLDFSYMRLDQTNLEFPGQIFDTDDLMTYGFRTRYVLENQDQFDRLQLDGWYNRTTLHGEAQHPAKRRQIPQLGLIAPDGTVVGGLNFIGSTDIDLASAGGRAAVTWGKAKEAQLTVGTDFRKIDQALNEFDNLFGLALPCMSQFNFPIPRSQESTVGMFADYVNPVDECLTVKAGGRGDWVYTNIGAVPPGFDCQTFAAQEGAIYHTANTDRDYGLWLLYATADYKLNEYVTLTAGTGHAERPPTLTELYAMEPFLAILQQGFTTVQGNPDLRPEELTQVDLGMRGDFGTVRAGLNGYFNYIHNYITYEATGSESGPIKLPSFVTNALTVRFVNTDSAILTGFETYGEVDANSYLTPFFTVSYVEGRDLTRDHRGASPAQTGIVLPGTSIPKPGIGNQGAAQEPLPMIPPLEARIGIRFHEPRKNPKWAVELQARADAPQDQVAASLGELPSAGFVVWDIRAYWQAYDGVLLTAGVQNIFDKFYREHLDLLTGNGVFQPGQSIYAGVELRY